jgi:diguanylate cyclase (GGDEF)-like protein
VKHLSYTVTDLTSLQAILVSDEIRSCTAQSQSLLVQVYTAQTDPVWIRDISALIMSSLPSAVLVGATTVGELAHGRTLTGQTVVGFTFFAATKVTAIAQMCPVGDELQIGAELARQIDQVGIDIAGVLLLATPLSINAADLLAGLENSSRNYPVFGGGAGDYAAMSHSMVFTATDLFAHGAIAVVLTGSDLHVESRTYLGWRALSKEMTITEADGMLVKTVDGKPAFDVYRRYLDIPDDENFFLNALEFPFLFQRNGEVLARVPVAVNTLGEIQFVADIASGEKFRVGYGDPGLIVADAVDIQRTMRDFTPQAVFLYTCGCRRFLMQQDVELETLPFEDIAPTFGFYTYGEFFGSTTNLQLLNSTMVAVGMREGISTHSVPMIKDANPEAVLVRDPYVNKHSRIVSRLVKFISAVTSELEQANREITQLSLTDRLTQLNNRMKLDAVLADEITIAIRYKQSFSLILLDIDHFKQVNDTHGHLVGDDVLIRIAKVLAENIRDTDTLGRWGGEEFLLILPHTDLDQACALAEKLRKSIAQETIPVVGQKTSSFGVTTYCPGDNVTNLIARSDEALYEAKKMGRNRVQAKVMNVE